MIISFVCTNHVYFSGRGGRFEVFAHAWTKSKHPDEIFEIADVSSLYPTIAMKNSFPVGKYEIWTDMQKLEEGIKYCPRRRRHFFNNNVEMIGLAHVQLRAGEELTEAFHGILYEDGKIVYGLCYTCAKNRKAVRCRHGKTTRDIIATLIWPEISFLIRIGYILVHVYEAYQYSSQLPILADFVKLIGANKLKHSTPSSNQSFEEYCKEVNLAMDIPPHFALNATDIKPDKQKRGYYKDCLVGFLGKFAQQNNTKKTVFVRSQSHLRNVFLQEDIYDIFDHGKVCQVVVNTKTKNRNVNRSANSIIYSYVMGLSRIFMHEKIIDITCGGGCVYSVQNDCIYFSRKLVIPSPLQYSEMFGSFKMEVNGPVKTFLAFGNKSSIVEYTVDGQDKLIIKARGFNLKGHLVQNLLSVDLFKLMMLELQEKKRIRIKIPQVQNRRNLTKCSFGELIIFQELSNELVTDRIILENLCTMPFGLK